VLFSVFLAYLWPYGLGFGIWDLGFGIWDFPSRSATARSSVADSIPAARRFQYDPAFAEVMTMIRIARPVAAVVLSVLMLAGSAAAQQQQSTRSIVNITGQLYRAQNDNHYTVFLVTPEGVIMSDPINRDFSRWLKNEIATRFKVPVRYVLYTHRDWDHASGGVVFADTAQFVGHVNMLAGLAPPEGRPSLPSAE